MPLLEIHRELRIGFIVSESAEAARQKSSLLRAYLALGGGVIALTLSPLFFRWADAPGLVTSFYRMAITTVLLLVLVGSSGKGGFSIPRKWLFFPILGGIASALDHSFWSTSIEITTVANATLLNNVSPLWVALFAAIIFREKLRGWFWFGLLAVMAGAAMVLGSTLFSRPSFALGDVLALTSSIFYAIFFLSTQQGRKVLKTLQYLLVMTATAAVVLGAVTALFGHAFFGYSTQTYLTFLAAALISQFGAYFLISYSLGRLPASVVTPTMVIQPVLTALLAVPITGEKLLPLQAFGGLITIAGVYLVNRARVGSKSD